MQSCTKTLCFSKTDSRNFPAKHNSRNDIVLYVCVGYARAFNHTARHLRSSVLVTTLAYRLVGARRTHTRSVVYGGLNRYYNNYYNFMLILYSPSTTVLFFLTSFFPFLNVLSTYVSVFCKNKKCITFESSYKKLCFPMFVNLHLAVKKNLLFVRFNRSNG